MEEKWERPEPTLSNQPEPMDRDTLIGFYESYCITFIDDGKAILSSQGGMISPIVIDEKLLLEPSAANLADFKNQLPKELLELSEPFAPTDETNEYIINGERRRIIDRAFDRFDWRGRRYYRLFRGGRASKCIKRRSGKNHCVPSLCCCCYRNNTTPCNVARWAGQVLLVNFVAIFTVIAGGCLVIISGLGNQEKNIAYVRTYVAR